MPRRVFKHLNRRRHELKALWIMRPFKQVLEDPIYWTLHRRNVTRAVAMGMFISFIPLPIHMIVATISAVIARVNIPATVAGVFLTNPFTMVPLFYLAYWVGCLLLGTPQGAFAFEPSWHWLTTGLLPVWKPFLLGCFVMGLVSAVVGYITLGLIWHITLVIRYRRRKASCRTQKCAIAEK